MTNTQTNEPTPKLPLRLWPGLIAAAALLLVRFILPVITPGIGGGAILGGMAGGLAIIIWWLFFSRAPWSERLGAIVLMVIALFATSRIVHESIANGMMGMMLPIFAIPFLCLALVVWAAASRRLSTGPRRASMVVAILLVCGSFTLLRTGGITGEAASDFHWRWEPTPEQRLLAQAAEEPTPIPAASIPAITATPSPAPSAVALSSPSPTETPKETNEAAAAPAAAKSTADWPGFRGSRRDSVIRGVRIETDWARTPPVQLWRRPIGPGWSSFAVHGDLLYTQEQRGEEELVACYKVSTGKPVWMHRDATRFWESNGGAGPRATPTFSKGRVYSLGATGILNALDAATGAVVWSRNAASDTHAKLPGWGFAGSPLVVGDAVIVAASGALAAYDLASGNPRWIGPIRGGGYSSPQLMTIDGVPQVLLMGGDGASSVAPADGALLWELPWPGDPIVQPALVTGGDLLITTAGASGAAGTRRIAVAHGPGGWTVKERWTSMGLKPYFNDFVVHKGHAFGFDGSILACIDLEDGKRKWKGGRYGNGQLVLLPEQDLLLVLSEEGELALVRATPDQFTEVARIPAIEGKTWNHPAMVGDVLLVRNGESMAAYRLSLADH